MAVHYRTQGIFLKKSARGESDELFTVYTKEFGKLRILGKAIRKITSKLRSGSGLFYLSEVEFIQGKGYKTLTDSILINNFKNIRQDLIKLRNAYKIARLLDELISKEEKDEKIWKLVCDIFERLDSWRLPVQGWSASGGEILYYYFFWHLVSILGYGPDISGCSIQKNKVNCDIIKILKVILKKDWHILSRLRLEPIHLRLLENTMEWYNNTVIKSHAE